jgi:Tfp pilus assembly protein PilO
VIWEEWARILVAIAASLTALGVIWTKAIKPMVDGIATIAERVKVLETLAEKASTLAALAADAVILVDLPTRLDCLKEVVDDLKVELGSVKDSLTERTPLLLRMQAHLTAIDQRTKTLEPNAGSSMADQVDRIDQNTQPDGDSDVES